MKFGLMSGNRFKLDLLGKQAYTIRRGDINERPTDNRMNSGQQRFMTIC